MLQAINDRIKGWLGIAVVIIIGLPFALWGIQSYLDDTGPQYAAKVNDLEISASEFERSVSIQRQQMLRQYGGELPIEENALRERTLTQLINQRMLEGVTYNNGYRISDSILTAKIKQQFSVDGVFDRVRFESSVAQLGMSIPMYEQALRSELRLQQMQTAIGNTSFVTRNEIKNLAALEEQTRDISVLTFNVEHFSTAKKPTEEEIKQYYEANLQRFMQPEKLKIDYVEITSETLAGDIEIDEAQIKKMYEDYVASVSGREERKARHILLAVKEEAGRQAAREKVKSLKQQLDQGKDFAELAREHSEDTGSAADGGDLGWVALGEMVKPFEQALFDLELSDNDSGVVSDIVETQFGFHLIKLEDVRSEAIEPLGVKRYAFEDELKADAVASVFYEQSEQLAALAYENPDNLDVVVEELGLKLSSSDYFTRSRGEGIAENEKIRNVAFSSLVLEQGSNSDTIEISPTHVVVIRLNKHVPATAIPFQDVSSKIENILIVQNGHKQTQSAALAAKARIEAGESIESVQTDGVSIKTVTAVGRKDNDKVSDPAILRNAFKMVPDANAKAAVEVVDLISGDVSLVVLNKVNVAENIPQDKLELVKSEALRESAIRDFSSILLALKESADIDKNTRILQK